MTVKGNLFILSAPSGAGKSSLITALLSQADQQHKMAMSVSHTTRKPRPGEIDGQHYHFVSVEQFKQLINTHAFYEYAQVFNNYYGTTKAAIEQQLEQGIDVFLDIDWQGAQQVRARKPEVTTIFIAPPSKEELARRLRGRGQDSDEVIRARMAEAAAECSHYHEFDYLIINDDFEQALTDLQAIVRTKSLEATKQSKKHKKLFSDLLANN